MIGFKSIDVYYWYWMLFEISKKEVPVTGIASIGDLCFILDCGCESLVGGIVFGIADSITLHW